MAKRDEEEVVVEVAVPVMDIGRYLAKNTKGKGIDDMLKVLFRGKIKIEAEWTSEVDSVINRRVY